MKIKSFLKNLRKHNINDNEKLDIVVNLYIKTLQKKYAFAEIFNLEYILLLHKIKKEIKYYKKLI